MPSDILPLLLALVAAGANIAGGAIVNAHSWASSSLRYFIALGSGFMLAVVFIEMLPESMELLETAPIWILVGYLIVHMFEHTFAAHLHFGDETHRGPVTSRTTGISALLGLLVHTFFDGVAIGAGFQVSQGTGTLVFLAVLLHKIPDGFTMSSIARGAGWSRRVAFNATALLGLSTVAGVVAVMLTGGSPAYALPLSAGATLYVAASDLIPEVNQESEAKVPIIVFAGVALFFLAHMFTS